MAKIERQRRPRQTTPTTTTNSVTNEFSSIKPVVTSAIIIKPPYELWTQIQDIRKLHDKAFTRWMPHINMMYPFFPGEHFRPSLIQLIQETMKDVKPFKIILKDIESFAHGKNSTFFLSPQNAIISLKLVHNKLFSIFPQCKELSERENGFSPHLTCGQVATARFNKFKVELQKSLRPIEWEVNEICLISREGDNPFEVKFSIPLYNGAHFDINELNFAPISIEPVYLEIDESKNMETAMNRTIKWIQQLDQSKLPKQKSALANAIKSLCIVTSPVTTLEYIYQLLQAEGFILEIGEEINYLKTLEDLKQNNNNNNNNSSNNSHRELNECINNVKVWVVQKQNSPKSKKALFNCLSYLIVTKTVIDPFDVIDNLIERKLIDIEDGYNGNNRIQKVVYTELLLSEKK